MPSTLQRTITVMQSGSSKPRLMPVASGQAIHKGDFLVADANGRVTQAQASTGAIPVPSTTQPTTNQICIADQEAASLAQDTPIQIVVVNDDTTLRMALTNGTTYAQFSPTMVGKNYDVFRLSDGNYYVHASSQTAPKVQIVGLAPDCPAADAASVVLVRPLATTPSGASVGIPNWLR